MSPSNPQNAEEEVPSPEVTDAELVIQCQAGDLKAFDVLVTRHRHKAFAMIYQIVRNEQDAWDLAQDGFVRAWKALPRFQGTAAFYTWLYRIMTNVAIDWLRKKHKLNESEFDENIDSSTHLSPGSSLHISPTPRTEMERAELRVRLEEAISKLSPDHRAVILLKEVEGLQYNEIAETMDCSIGTVMSRLFHARRNLQRMLADTYEKF